MANFTDLDVYGDPIVRDTHDRTEVIRVRKVMRGESNVYFDLRKKIDSPEYRGYTKNGFKLTSLKEARLLRDALDELLQRENSNWDKIRENT